MKVARGDRREDGNRLTFPVCLFWAEDLQDIDAASSVGGLQDHVGVDADLLADAGTVSACSQERKFCFVCPY